MKNFFKEILFKRFFLFLWKRLLFFQILFNSVNKSSKNIPKVFYAGSRKGDKGGPMVKIKKLKNFFPEYQTKFNIVYLLSNSSFLTPSSINLIKRRSLPIVLNQNGVFYPAWFDGDWKRENSKMSHIYHAADYVLWQSSFCKKASEKFLGRRKGAGEILYNAVDTSFFKPNKYLNNLRFTFLITGNIRKKSNYRISSVLYALKEIIKEDKDICLTISGYIEDKKYFFSEIDQLDLAENVNFLKTYTQKEAPKIYQHSDAYITMSYQDNCPTAVIEAMACGLPILFSSSGGIPELVDKNSGIGLEVSENWNVTKIPEKYAIVEGMKKVIENKIIMSEASRYRASQLFDIKKWTIKHKLIFEKLLES